MKTIDELIYYCNEDEPVGALMLTGEWGCGKTYLIENDLRAALSDSHIIVRVSLFGISTIETLNMNVKKQWVAQCTSILSKIQDSDKAVAVGKTIFGGVSSIVPILKDMKNAVLSVDFMDYVDIKPKVDEKKVILAFDDLERSRLSTIDILGCINEYCENYGFNTIIIANEERLSENNKENINNSEIKEKIVERTVSIKPEFGAVICSLLYKQEWSDGEYKDFLIDNEMLISELFETDISMKISDVVEENEIRQEKLHNIRSLKCALHDFYRVYKKLVAYNIPDIDKFLYSFVAYTIATKAGIVKKGKYGFLFSDENVKKMYPFFSHSTIPLNVKEWIVYGVWNEELIDEELIKLANQMKVSEPKDVLRYNDFMELEEDIIKAGFSGLLQDCYNGKFTLNDYVLLIRNSCMSRVYNIELPEVIDWKKVLDGIKKCFERYIEENESENYMLQIISNDSRESFNESELEAYDLIANFRDNNVVLFENNKKYYMISIQKEGLRAFIKCQHKEYKAFDKDMAEITLASFRDSSQSDKVYFPEYFGRMWKLKIDSCNINLEITKIGLEKLMNELKELKENYIAEAKNIALNHTKKFIKSVEQLITLVDERLKHEEGK